MKSLKREIRFWIFSLIIGWAIYVLPKDAINTWKWFSQMPIND